ncbi:FmdB family transcriptional regulator [Nonomuraea longispora]|uniref:FmdB family transcriptional regulator n=1 Tax=Nonomuraea longispora TaxID=1848320 RepID=A0A4R4NJZ9_9ACTN|nr:FmdB family zinc ribbon protein [Nonomuraea longispora]TDC09671.1 FmdB family transcriptional regulator [Nonomuraea longispora]
MPTYQYACNDCGEQLEAVQKFTDDALTVCPSCEGNLRKVFSAVGIVFKGSGFYKTDSRPSTSGASTSSSSKSADASSSESSSKSSESKSGDSGSSTSAPAPAAASN